MKKLIILAVAIASSISVFSQKINIDVKKLEYYSYHEEFPDIFNTRENWNDVHSKYMFDCEKKTMTTEFQNYPEQNAVTPVLVQKSKNGIYTFRFNDTDIATSKMLMQTVITVDTDKKEVLYTIYMPEYQVFKNFKFTDFDLIVSK
jgi:hypothetical protein